MTDSCAGRICFIALASLIYLLSPPGLSDVIAQESASTAGEPDQAAIDDCLEANEIATPGPLDELNCAEQIYEFEQTRSCDSTGINSCATGEQPRPVQWARPSVEYRINDAGSQNLHPGENELTDDLKHSVIESFETWNEQECSGFEMIYAGKTTADEPSYDQNLSSEENINIVVWQDDQWPHELYDAVALTTVTFRPSNGQILSSDIEINTADYLYSDHGESGHMDFRNTLTHEVGHFLGLDHSPNRSATMFASADAGETNKRELHTADIAGICFIYPDGESYDLPGSDEDSDNGSRWCAAASGSTDPTLIVVFLVLIGLAVGRRRSAG